MKKNQLRLSLLLSLSILLVLTSCFHKNNNIKDPSLDSTDQTTFIPKVVDTVLYNPYMGWVPWAHTGNSYAKQPFKLVLASITWRELEPTKGNYDFKSIETKNQFSYWQSKGVKIILQFNMDYPDSVKHMDIPDWLYEEIGHDGTWYNYNNENTKMGFSPNYKNPVLIAYHKKLIQAFAKRYDTDPRVFMILVGSCGHWGEWHTTYIQDHTLPGVFPPIQYSDQYAQHYADNFKNKFLAMRYPSQVGKDNKMGLFNNCFGDYDQTQRWFLDWINNGHTDSYNPGYTHPTMPDYWLNAPAGGEFGFYPGTKFLEDSAMTETIRQAKENHISWLGPCCPVHLAVGDRLQPNIDKMMKTIGYRYVIQSVSHANSIKAGYSLTVDMDWANNGTAPFYFNWPVELSLSDSTGKIVATNTDSERKSIDLTSLLPGTKSFTSSISIPSNLPSGQYKLCVSIIDPETKNPGIALAIDGKRSDGRYTLSTVNVVGDTSAVVTSPGFFFSPIKTNTPTPTYINVSSSSTPTSSAIPTGAITITPTASTPTSTATSTATSTRTPTVSPTVTPTATPSSSQTNNTPIKIATANPSVYPGSTDKKHISFTLNNKMYKVNDKEYILDTAPIIYQNRMYIPLRGFSDSIGAEISWISNEKSVLLNYDKKQLKLWINRNIATINGATVKIDKNDPKVLPIIVNPGRTMLPLRFITENLGYKVTWDPKNKTALLESAP
ncbi:MAG: stalk domain-containing protein [Bacillota bacterium]|nr:stalk domain-containing protein [Bacillota bacterium]